MRLCIPLLLLGAIIAAPGAALGHSAAGASESPDDADLRSARDFAVRIGALTALQQSVVRAQSAGVASSDPKKLAANQTDIAAGLVAARRGANQGDIFTPDAALRFRRLIHKAFHEGQGRAMRQTIREDDHVRPVVLRVNEVYPESIPTTTMPPTLLRALPVLPASLGYRIVGSALVLVDVRSNLIVDFMPDAIPADR